MQDRTIVAWYGLCLTHYPMDQYMDLESKVHMSSGQCLRLVNLVSVVPRLRWARPASNPKGSWQKAWNWTG